MIHFKARRTVLGHHFFIKSGAQTFLTLLQRVGIKYLRLITVLIKPVQFNQCSQIFVGLNEELQAICKFIKAAIFVTVNCVINPGIPLYILHREPGGDGVGKLAADGEFYIRGITASVTGTDITFSFMGRSNGVDFDDPRGGVSPEQRPLRPF